MTTNDKESDIVGWIHIYYIVTKKKYPLATIDKNLMKRALKKGADIITLKNNKITFYAFQY